MGSRLGFGVQGLGRARGPKFVADGSRRDETLVFEKKCRSRLDETVAWPGLRNREVGSWTFKT